MDGNNTPTLNVTTAPADAPLLNLGLNDGTFMPASCAAVLQAAAHPTGLRNYSSPDNRLMREAIAKADGVRPEHVFVHNGSGPILKQVIPSVIRQKIMSSPLRMLSHVLFKNGCPLITPTLTYEKAPAKAVALGLKVEMIESRPEDGFRLDRDELRKRLRKRPGFVYVVNPNNPTGHIQLEPGEVGALLKEFPDSLFWLDEAYIHYAGMERSVSRLVPDHPNLLVSRTFSFAWGLAAVRIGYLLGAPEEVERQSATLTDYRVGALQEALAVAALTDPDHLPHIQRATAEAREQLMAGLAGLPGVEVFPSVTNFLLCRLTAGSRLQTGAELVGRLAARGIRIKSFAPFGPYRHDAYFRITTGLPDEQARLIAEIRAILA